MRYDFLIKSPQNVHAQSWKRQQDMTPDETKYLVKKAENLVTDIFKTQGKNRDTVSIIMKKLYQLGDEIIEATEKKENVANKIDCNVGCSYCCYTRVTLTPAEALLIGQYVKENYSLKQTDGLMKRISNILRMTKGKSPEELVLFWGKTPCIFLDQDKCTIYNVRPFICRAWHSLSSDQCKRAFESGNQEAEIDSTPFRGIILGALRDGLSHVCDSLGCESKPTDLTKSLKTILSQPDPCEAWVKGESLFHL